MQTQTIIEGLLYICPELKDDLTAIHILNNSDRKWKPKEHVEYPYLKYFNDPHIITIISKQIHTYIIGDLEKRSSRHIINVEGFNSYHLVLNRYELIKDIKEKVKQKLFLPSTMYDRIIYMNKDDLFIFNKCTALSTKFFSSKSRWTIGADYYDAGAKVKVVNANQIIDTITRDAYEKENK